METTQFVIEIIPWVMKIVFAAIFFLFVRYIWPMVKPFLQYKIIQWLVNAAEKKAETGAIDKDTKKQFVIRIMELVKIPVNDFTMAMLESAVKELDLLEEKVLDYIKKQQELKGTTESDEDIPEISVPDIWAEGGGEDAPEKETADPG